MDTNTTSAFFGGNARVSKGYMDQDVTRKFTFMAFRSYTEVEVEVDVEVDNHDGLVLKFHRLYGRSFRGINILYSWNTFPSSHMIRSMP